MYVQQKLKLFVLYIQCRNCSAFPFFSSRVQFSTIISEQQKRQSVKQTGFSEKEIKSVTKSIRFSNQNKTKFGIRRHLPFEFGKTDIMFVILVEIPIKEQDSKEIGPFLKKKKFLGFQRKKNQNKEKILTKRLQKETYCPNLVK